MEQNALQKILDNSGLDKTMAQYFLDNFTDAFEQVAEWEKKAKEIVVNSEQDTQAMEKAAVGSKALIKIRTGIEKSRTELKKPFLNGGRLVDHIAGVLTELVKPVEEDLTKKAKYIELRAKERELARQKEAMRLLHEKELAEAKARQEEEDRREAEYEATRLENERLRKEKEEADWKAGAAAREAERVLALEKKKADDALEAEREKARKEKADADAKLEAERQETLKKQQEAERERKALEARLSAMVQCPVCGERFVPGEKVLV
jgi:hypothetical protein